jgi:hypothetical protein
MACGKPEGLLMTSVTVPLLAVSVLWLKASFVLLALRLTVVEADTTLATARAAVTATTAAIRSLRATLGMGLLGGGLVVNKDAPAPDSFPRPVRGLT